jgi:hypothetical protein
MCNKSHSAQGPRWGAVIPNQRVLAACLNQAMLAQMYLVYLSSVCNSLRPAEEAAVFPILHRHMLEM